MDVTAGSAKLLLRVYGKIYGRCLHEQKHISDGTEKKLERRLGENAKAGVTDKPYSHPVPRSLRQSRTAHFN